MTKNFSGILIRHCRGTQRPPDFPDAALLYLLRQVSPDLKSNFLANGQRSGGSRAGRVQYVQRPWTAHQTEILDQGAIRRHRLRAHPRAAGLEIFLANFGDEPLQRLAE